MVTETQTQSFGKSSDLVSLFKKNNLLTLPETNSLHLKMDGWKTSFLLGWPIFRYYVSFRECIYIKGETQKHKKTFSH